MFAIIWLVVYDIIISHAICIVYTIFKNRKYNAKVGQDNVNIGVVTIFRLANTSLLQVLKLNISGTVSHGIL